MQIAGLVADVFSNVAVAENKVLVYMCHMFNLCMPTHLKASL